MRGKKSKQKKTFFAKEYYMLLELCQKAYEDVASGENLGSEDFWDGTNWEVFLKRLSEDFLRRKRPFCTRKEYDSLSSVYITLMEAATEKNLMATEEVVPWNDPNFNGTINPNAPSRSSAFISASIYEAVRQAVKFKMPRLGMYSEDEMTNDPHFYDDNENDRFAGETLVTQIPFESVFLHTDDISVLAYRSHTRIGGGSLMEPSIEIVTILPLDSNGSWFSPGKGKSAQDMLVMPVFINIKADAEVTIKTTQKRKDTIDFNNYMQELVSTYFFGDATIDRRFFPLSGEDRSQVVDEDDLPIIQPYTDPWYNQLLTQINEVGISDLLETGRNQKDPLSWDQQQDALGGYMSGVATACHGMYLFFSFLRMQQLQHDKINMKTFGIIKPEMMKSRKVKPKERPLVEFHTLDVELEKEVNVTDLPTSRICAKKRLHRVRGHFRNYRAPIMSGPNKGKTRVFVRECLKGDADLGVLISDYNLHENDSITDNGRPVSPTGLLYQSDRTVKEMKER